MNADVLGYSFLANAIRRLLANEFGDAQVFTICFLNAPIEKHPAWVAGLPGVIESLWRNSRLVPNPIIKCHGNPTEFAWHSRPVFVLGLGSASQSIISRSTDDKQRALFQWPGIAYLPYGFTQEQLIATARQVVEGAKQPLPAGLLPTVSDVLCRVDAFQHWLEGRQNNAKGSLDIFESVERGEIRLNDSNLEPVTAISEKHRAMLDQLWDLEIPAAWFAPRIGGLAPLKNSIAGFETRWQALESARTALRAGGTEERAKGLSNVVLELRLVCEALSAAIMATRDLTTDLTDLWEGNSDGNPNSHR